MDRAHLPDPGKLQQRGTGAQYVSIFAQRGERIPIPALEMGALEFGVQAWAKIALGFRMS
jgi:hypothetical protein